MTISSGCSSSPCATISPRDPRNRRVMHMIVADNPLDPELLHDSAQIVFRFTLVRQVPFGMNEGGGFDNMQQSDFCITQARQQPGFVKCRLSKRGAVEGNQQMLDHGFRRPTKSGKADRN